MSTALLLSAVFLSAPAAAASFDCGKASTPAEKTVCGDMLLSALDGRLGKAYAAARKAGEFSEEVRQTARDFQSDRASCDTDKGCILATYIAVLQNFGSMGKPDPLPSLVSADLIADGNAPRSNDLPNRIGECVTTQIESVHPRLAGDGPPTDEDYDFGTGIGYANGGVGVSYEREEEIIRSKPGDAVTLCLISIPRHCPPGDHRGRFYTATNSRTGGTWTLPDSQHMCGGA